MRKFQDQRPAHKCEATILSKRSRLTPMEQRTCNELCSLTDEARRQLLGLEKAMQGIHHLRRGLWRVITSQKLRLSSLCKGYDKGPVHDSFVEISQLIDSLEQRYVHTDAKLQGPPKFARSNGKNMIAGNQKSSKKQTVTRNLLRQLRPAPTVNLRKRLAKEIEKAKALSEHKAMQAA